MFPRFVFVRYASQLLKEGVSLLRWLLTIVHTGDFPRGVGHRVEKGWGLTKCAVVLLNDIIMVKINIYS